MTPEGTPRSEESRPRAGAITTGIARHHLNANTTGLALPPRLPLK
ncbi:hypothetical protein HMPREF9597_00323 [Cutibacterium acnes HL005PA4]|nr:hypothetical protein HMPREF9612_00072 [Cutibacterium acnes HL063PA2]EFS80352.1 hypothetical protein HMPREF9597_00323 [Cutibacterium acnes HL005PA4]EFT00799.1 hypothetical protein HMPREF9609_00449 [Cutibacterium acnes HL027PA1]EFT22045.1 hypothetical protein HMPREF9566_00154 [Cutibacterium acnes HL045PA1]EGE94313.1 hypothetical protein HMPREF9571_00942 [Cutibacterium acnes HL043PA2]EGF02500.1 hypothetical protein HMPREF9581_00119 [Cutibacterium acnes HL087PA3]EGF04651.1 hypothetical protein